MTKDTTQSSSATTGALIVAGGAGIAKKLFVGEVITAAGDVTTTSSTASTSATTGAITTAGGLGVAKALYAGEAIVTKDTTQSSSATTGSLMSRRPGNLEEQLGLLKPSSIFANTAHIDVIFYTKSTSYFYFL